MNYPDDDLFMANGPAREKALNAYRERIMREQEMKCLQNKRKREAKRIERKINFATTVFALAVGSIAVLATVYLVMSLICRSALGV